MPNGVTKTAGSFIDAMRSHPLELALVVMNFALIGFIYVQGMTYTEQRKENVKLFVEVQREVQKLLSQCIVPPPPERRSEAPNEAVPPN